MPNMQLSRKLTVDEVVLDAQSTDETAGAVGVSGLRHMTVLIEWSAGVSAGVVEVEEASTTTYAGTWSNITTVTTGAASSTDAVHIEGSYKALRARISTAITGGTVTVTIFGG
tara:strand:+ start:1165 stop:1503 length:339 start_codon:yes stop_codon:yes gene_type:complete